MLESEFLNKSFTLNPYIKTYQELKKLTVSKLKNLENIEEFYDIMDFLKNKHNTNFRQLDIFMWRKGKEINAIKKELLKIK